jgi:hypothetical protein
VASSPATPTARPAFQVAPDRLPPAVRVAERTAGSTLASFVWAKGSALGGVRWMRRRSESLIPGPDAAGAGAGAAGLPKLGAVTSV